ncbi:MAG TPA: ATP-binding protein [Candidatus Binataceae bacterium]|nr:ATP-binding protein [Candidatus Binataceae bacterium]
MASAPTFRFIAAVVLGMLPAAVLLIVLGAQGAVPLFIVGLVLALGLGAGLVFAIALGGAWERRAERLDAVASALEERRLPSHVLPDDPDPMGRAEHRLLGAADKVIDEFESLTEQRDELEAILRSMTEAVVVTGQRGEVILLNGAARKMFALDADTDYRTTPLIELCRDPRLQDFVENSMRSTVDGVASAEIAIQIPAPLHVGASAIAIRTPRGPAFVFVFHDITRLKSYETLRADFISNLTHELRTPLSALYGYAETLIRGVDDPETVSRFLNIIERQARRLARLLDDLVSLSDLERGLTPLKFEATEPRRVIEEAVELMQEYGAKRGIRIEVKCPAEIPKLYGDRDRLHQVMLNLIDNAIKYTPREGLVTAEARAMAGWNDAAETPGVALIVSDTGEGIPAADIPRLTERFYRVDRARSRELGGTGLGLAIVKHIVSLHHGALKIESRLREGTSVSVWVPQAPLS